MTSGKGIRVLRSVDDLFRAAADEFAAQAVAAVKAKGKFSVALSGGSTPKGLFKLLATSNYSGLPWESTYFFFGDERNVPQDHPDSNYRMANEALLSKIPNAHVFPIPTETGNAESAAIAYEQTLQEFFNLQAGQFPRFDLVLLGLGPDGHTASLFPGTTALQEQNRLVVANWVEKFKTYRITFTFPVLNHAASVMFLAAGKEKAPAIHSILEEGIDLPASRVQPVDGRLVWLIDREAKGSLSIPDTE